MDNVLRFTQRGGKIALGDDILEDEAPWYRLGMPRMELTLLQEAGISAIDIITAATKHGAEICSIDRDVGAIENGKLADILILEGNPLKDLNCLFNVKMVLKEGRIVS